MNLAIHFNPARGFEDEALALARRLFAYYDEAIESLALIPVSDEDLDVALDQRIIHSLSRTGRLPRVSDVREALGNEPAPSLSSEPPFGVSREGATG